MPANLLEQTVLQDTAQVAGGNTFFRATRNAIDWKVHRGWTMPLGATQKGERSIDQIRNLGSSVIITTTVLSAFDSTLELCSASSLPANYIYILNALNGASARSFDMDRDGRLDDVSVVLVSAGGYSRGMAITNLTSSKTLTSDIRERYAIDESSGESVTTPKSCRTANIEATGTGTDPLPGGVSCQIAWNRSQYQLSRPPSN